MTIWCLAVRRRPLQAERAFGKTPAECGKRVIYSARRPRVCMTTVPADSSPSALLLFLRKNWKWLIVVVVVAVFVMMVASD